MADRTNLKRQREQIERERAAGIIRVTVRIPEKRKADLMEIVNQWKEAAPDDRNH